jgi:hypothetical protein
LTIGMPEGTRRLCLAYDVEGYSGHGTRRELGTQEKLAGLLSFALSEAGLAAGSYQVQMQGDGGLALLPTGGGVDEPRLLVRLIRAFEIGLAEINEGLRPDWRVRLRLALGQGVVHQGAHGYVGPAVVHVCRIRDSDAVRSALAGSAGFLVVAVSDGLYKDVLAHGYHGLPGPAFSKIQAEIKEFRADAWIYLPGAVVLSAPAGGGPAAAPGSDGPAASAAATLVQDNNASRGGLLIATQGGSVYIDGSAGGRTSAQGHGAQGHGAREHRAQKGSGMPLEPELAALAAVAAAALVTAMTTDAWTQARDAVVRLFRRADPKRHEGIATRLDDNASLVSGAPDPGKARAAMQPLWELEFTELLRTHPDSAADLAALLERLGGSPRGGQMVQTNTAHDFGTVFAAQAGNVHLHPDVASASAPPPSSPDDTETAR